MKAEVKEISNGIIEYKGVVYYNKFPDFASQFALPGKEQIIEILREFKPFIGFDEDNKKCYGNIEDNSFEFIADEILKLSDLKENSEKGNKDYLNECIEKATPNLSKIKDVDKELDEIRGIKPSDLPTEEEIEKYIKSRTTEIWDGGFEDVIIKGFRAGAKWMRDRLNNKR
jgi:hypothetical protein